MIIGQKSIVDYFTTALQNESLSHTYCFVGSAQVGKRALANDLAALLLKTTVAKLPIHPDYYYVERTEDEKTGKLKRDLSVAQARDLKSRLQSRSWSNGYRVTIIDEAELLNDESANALLKTLEEPPEKSIIFLLTENDQLLLPTIRSRCQLFYFNLLSDQEIIDGLIKLGYPKDKIDLVLPFVWGRVGKAIELLKNDESLVHYQEEYRRWEKILGEPFYNKLKIIEDIFGDKEDAVRGRAHLQTVIDIWIMLWREAMLGKRKKTNLLPAQIQEIIDNLFEAKKLLTKNIHPRLLVEQAILKY